MEIIGGLDVHRKQITFDYVEIHTGEVRRGEVRPATREHLRGWLSQFKGKRAAFALEATTGWRFVVEELQRAGVEPHLAEPADTKALRGPKKRAKTDRIDARHLRELLLIGRLPESWIPPSHIQDLRTLVRMRKTLVEERTAFLQRIHAQLFHHGHPQERNLLTKERRARLEQLEELPEVARKTIELSLRMIEHINQELKPIEEELRSFARRQVGCRALMRHYGIGELTSVAILAELGDSRRFSSSRHAVRFAGLDITVSQSDGKRSSGKLSRQGSPVLRWAVFEAAQTARRDGSPEHGYYTDARDRLGPNRACLAVARKLIRKAHHTLRELGDEALRAPSKVVERVA
jgi:transposase